MHGNYGTGLAPPRNVFSWCGSMTRDRSCRAAVKSHIGAPNAHLKYQPLQLYFMRVAQTLFVNAGTDVEGLVTPLFTIALPIFPPITRLFSNANISRRNRSSCIREISMCIRPQTQFSVHLPRSPLLIPGWRSTTGMSSLELSSRHLQVNCTAWSEVRTE